jgi:HlyD family secretion protein
MGMDRKIEKKKWPPKRIATYSIAGAFFIIILYLLIFQTSVSTLNVDLERITVSTVVKSEFAERIPIMGNVLPINTFYLVAEEGGRVEEIFLEAGAMVKKGDKILRLSNTNLLMSIMNNEAEVSRASNDLRSLRLQMETTSLNLKKQRADTEYYFTKIKRTFESNKKLYEENLIPRLEYEKLKDEYEYQKKMKALTIESQKKDVQFRKQQINHLETSVNRMQQNLELVKQQLEKLVLRAPIPGQLTSMVAEIGESKKKGQKLGYIDVMDGFKVRAGIDEHYLSRIEKGKVGKFDFAGNSFGLTISKIFPEVNAEGKFVVDLNFNEKEPNGIRRGLTLHIMLQLSDLSEAILLPKGGFFQTTGGNWVFIVDESGDYATKRNIRTGRENPQYFEILEGLKPGEQVVTSSYENYGNMDRLNLKGKK